MKKTNKIGIYSLWILLICIIQSCDNNRREVMEFAGNNRVELEKVLTHYKNIGDKRKVEAAKFLISYMGHGKFSYEGAIINHYDTILQVYDSLRCAGVYVGDPIEVTKTWSTLERKYGKINISMLNKKYDCQNLTAAFIIQNIDQAFNAWEKSPLYNPKDFDVFCEYILPYRVEHETVEVYRDRYYKQLKHIVDTAKNVEGIVKGFNQELTYKLQYRSSKLLWDYPLEFPMSKMEIGHRGSCRQLTTFETLAMRACGLPVTIDRAVWANRSLGHSWNVLILDSGKIFPFEALDKSRTELLYKPAKIFRRTYSYDLKLATGLSFNDVPQSIISLGESDVTNEYCQVYDLEIPIRYTYTKYNTKKHAVIGVFDNKGWRIVYYGVIKSGKMNFRKMASDVAYIAGYYDNGKIIPANEPFLLHSNGKIQYCVANKIKKINMTLDRKFPRFKRIEELAMGLRRTNAEGANYTDFRDSTIFFSIYDVPYQVTYTTINNNKRYRFVRFHSSSLRNANYAEIEFYGKTNKHSKEEKLKGKIIGYPVLSKKNEHPYTHAMDGDLETWFEKKKDSIGWVGLDFGKGNKKIITGIRYCPRSDTNFIIIGDKYELFYWDNKQWKSMGIEIASDYKLTYSNVPIGTIYLLHNHTRGKEERIFTYKKGKQVWW